ncbi:MAG: M16 family metallopeptidase [Phycisphaerales bacterium]
MTLSRFVTVLAAAAGILASTCRAQDSTPLPVDPAVVQGELPNGLRYMVQKHSNPPSRAVMWIHISSGSLNETDPQRGIAHYLEHMAFNGSTNFPPGEVVKFFEGLGMTFGRDQNAFTSFDQTVYQLSLPDVKDETITRGLTFFHDVARGLSLLDAEIDNERQIILEEKTARKSAQSRIGEQMMKRVLPGSTFGERLPIGTDETVGSVKRPDFLDYYNRYYVLSNMTLMIVADEEPEKVVALVREVFGKDAQRVPTPEDRPVNAKPYDASFAVVITDPEMPRAQISIARVDAPRPPTRTKQQMRAEFIDALAGQAFNRRMEDLKSRSEMVGQFVFAGTNQTANVFREAQIMSMGKPEDWKPMLDQIARELVRAKQYGFSDSEIELARKGTLAAMEQAAEREATQPAGRIIGRLNQVIAAGEQPMSAAQGLELGRELLPSITASEVSTYFASEFKTDAVRFTLATAPAGAPTEPELLAAGQAALAQKVEKLAKDGAVASLMAKPPTAGVVAESSVHEASGVWSGWLANGVRVHHRFMDEEKSSVSVGITLYGGDLLETAATRGLTEAGSTAWGRQRALKSLTSSQIRDTMTGKKVAVGGGAGDGGLGLSISGSPEDLETGFQLAYLMLTEPVIEPAALTDWKTLQKQSIELADKDPGSMFGRLLPEAIYPAGEVRVRPLTLAQVDAVTIEAAQSWLNEQLRTSPIEVSIVGDIPRDRAIELAKTYLGSLPARERISAEFLSGARTLTRPAHGPMLRKDVTTTTDQGTVFVGFYGPDTWQEDDSRAMGIASRVLSTRMITEVREKAQLVYSIRASVSSGDIYPGFGLFSAASTTQPAKADALIEKLREMFATFAKDGPTEEELGVAKLQISKTIETSVRQRGYWLAATSQATFLRSNMESVVNADALIAKLSREQVTEVFRKYYGDGKLIVVEVRPAPAEGAR